MKHTFTAGLAMRALHSVSWWGGVGGSCKAYKVVGVVANAILVKTRNNAFTGLPSNSVFFTIESDI